LRCLVLALLLLGLVGCARHYQVTDPASGRVYYTTDVDREGSAAIFEDSKTGDEITLQSSEIKKISEEEFERQVGKK